MTQPSIILVRPQLGENIGMAARATHNCELTDFRLAQPKEPWPNKKAISSAAGAHPFLEKTKVFANVDEALSDLNFVLATSARPRHMTKPVYSAEGAVKILQEKIAEGMKVGIMFGPERTGMDNDEISRADGLIEIALNPDYASLNLAQAVLLIGYEWLKLKRKNPDFELRTQGDEFASKQELIDFFEHLEHELMRSGFLRHPHKRDVMTRNIRNMFLRTNYTSQEVRTLRGIISSLVDPYFRDRTPPSED